MLYINHSGKYIDINFNMKIPFPSCSAPSFSSIAPLAPSLVPPAFSLVQSAPLPPPPASLLPSTSSLPSSLAPPPSSFDSLASASFPSPPLRAPVAPGASVSSGGPHSSLGASTPGWSGAAGALHPDSAYFYNDFDDSLVKEEKEAAAFSKAFHEVVSLVMGFFLVQSPILLPSPLRTTSLWKTFVVLSPAVTQGSSCRSSTK